MPVNVPMDVNRMKGRLRLWNILTTISKGVSCRRRIDVLDRHAERSTISRAPTEGRKVQKTELVSTERSSTVVLDKIGAVPSKFYQFDVGSIWMEKHIRLYGPIEFAIASLVAYPSNKPSTTTGNPSTSKLTTAYSTSVCLSLARYFLIYRNETDLVHVATSSSHQ